MAKLIPYIRVSTDDQNTSVEIQQQRIQRFCDFYGHTLACPPIIDESVSGGKAIFTRPGGHILEQRLLDGEADGVIATVIDRMFRLAVDGLNQADWFQKKGLDLVFTDDMVDTSHPDGWMAFAQKVVAADWERRKIGYRTRLAMQKLRADGKNNSQTPFGLIEVDGLLYRDPERWPQRERVMELVNSAPALSLDKACKQLHRDGIKPPQGDNWHKSTVSRIAQTHHEFSHIADLPAELAKDED